jgi:hypothetical protein
MFAGNSNLSCRMETNKPLARAGYLLAFILVITPFLDTMPQLMPLRLGDERWRFGAIGQISNLLLVPLLGLFLAIAVAALTDSRRVKRVIGAVCGTLAFLLAVMSVLFILDYFQVRTVVTPRFQHATKVASTTVMIKNVFSIVALALFSRAGFAGRGSPARKIGPPVIEPLSTPLIPLSGAQRAE